MARKNWLEKMIKATKDEKVEMPWTRGARRAEMVARRDGDKNSKSA